MQGEKTIFFKLASLGYSRIGEEGASVRDEILGM